MNSSTRILVNTLAQYTRTIFNLVLSLYAVRLILAILGADDYGIYTLVAGVTSMLAFVTNALMSTTQRYMSFYRGHSDISEMKKVFSNSELVHLIFGVFTAVVLIALMPLLFNGLLNIPPERVHAARIVYAIVVLMLFTTFIAAPFRALLVAHENIIYTSVTDILDGVFRVGFILALPHIGCDHLIAYALIMLGVQIFNLLAFSIFCFCRYEECIFPRISLMSRAYLHSLASYAGWVMYGTGCTMGRTQGIAIVVNRFLSTAANAAYGIGLQVSAAISNVSTALLNATRPQIARAEGAGDRQRALTLSTRLCRYSFFLMSAVCVPCIFEMPCLLQLWLKDVPHYAVLFARMAVAASLADTLTLGLSAANEAIGNIRKYNLVIATMKLAALPLSILLMVLGMGPEAIVASFVGMEVLSAFVRIPFLRKNGGLDAGAFLHEMALRNLAPLVVCIAVCVFSTTLMSQSVWRLVLTSAGSIAAYFPAFWAIGLTPEEKTFAKERIDKAIHKRKKA